MKPLVLLTALLILSVPSFAQTPEWRGDRFLVKQGLLTGEPTKTMPASGEKLVPAP